MADLDDEAVVYEGVGKMYVGLLPPPSRPDPSPRPLAPTNPSLLNIPPQDVQGNMLYRIPG
jgi:hypothetical protein